MVPSIATTMNKPPAFGPNCTNQLQLEKLSPGFVGADLRELSSTAFSNGKIDTVGQANNKAEYNLPPIFTPLHIRRTVDAEDGLFQLQRKHSLPQEQGRNLLLTPPRVPSLPKPKPFNGKTRRAVSDTQVHKGSPGERRSIFGHYFDPRQQHQQQQVGQSQSSHRNDHHHQHWHSLHETRRPRSYSTNEVASYPRSSSSSFSSPSSSMAISFPEQKPLDYRMFAPPKAHASASAICGRLASVQIDQKTLMSTMEKLPPLPSPLRRFCSEPKHGRSLTHGMYPLMTPVSILRPSSYRASSTTTNMITSRSSDKDVGKTSNLSKNKRPLFYHHSSSTSSSSTSSLSLSDLNESQRGRSLPAVKQVSFNLTDSLRILNIADHEDRALARRNTKAAGKTLPTIASTGDLSVQADNDGINVDFESDREKSKDEDGTTPAGVRFDPRVTVTEFEDEVERAWYNDWELEVLKRETIVVAQRYILTHPMEAEKYNRAKLDPVTGTWRKRALFSLPALNAESIEDETSNGNAEKKCDFNALPINRKELQKLTKNQVNTILVVDPNPAILGLFRKSLGVMFPMAELVTAQSGEEAVKLALEHMDFDIAIVEQCLNPTPSRQPCGGNQLHHRRNNTMPSNKSMPNIQEDATFLALLKPGSFTTNYQHSRQSPGECRGPSCGAELLKALLSMKGHASCGGCSLNNSTTTMASGEASAINAPRREALLIGVSMKPDRDAKVLQQAGADVIWGKPIPRVGDALRNQLLEVLLAKRRRASQPATPGENDDP